MLFQNGFQTDLHQISSPPPPPPPPRPCKELFSFSPSLFLPFSPFSSPLLHLPSSSSLVLLRSEFLMPICETFRRGPAQPAAILSQEKFGRKGFMPSKRRANEEKRRRGEPVVGDSKRLLVLFPLLSYREEHLFYANRIDSIFQSELLTEVDPIPVPQRRILVIIC